MSGQLDLTIRYLQDSNLRVTTTGTSGQENVNNSIL